jgi:transposase
VSRERELTCTEVRYLRKAFKLRAKLRNTELAKRFDVSVATIYRHMHGVRR